MNSIEQQLVDEKQRMDSLKAPEELEMRLRNALNTATPKRTKRITPMWKVVAIAIIFMVIVGNNYNAFAYYGKKLLGFDEIINGTLKELNEAGMGQIVDETTTLANGTMLTINGLMSDVNQLIMYYTLSNPDGVEEDSDIEHFRPSNISGFLTNSFMESGTSIVNEDHTEIKGTMFFEPVSPFAKNLTLHFWQEIENNQMKEDVITFDYHPDEAMQTGIKKTIKDTFKVDRGSIRFHSITATPTMTVVKGSLNVENFDRVNGGELYGIELIANGTPIEILGSSASSSLSGKKFDIRYDTLPEQLDTLELVMKEFVGYKKLEEKLSLASVGDKPFSIDDTRKLWVKDVYTTSQGVEITIVTDEDVMLDGVSIQTENKNTVLNTTRNQIYTKQEDGRQLKERTLLFDTMIEPEYLLVEGMHYMKTYNQIIEIPVD
ncbi:DUF4179 domain-containing protein [Paenibacillus crassostreae]|uniref:DUF4179 domain-containing protein n=1 Tax=Paenibacillus crassostreae TaxID=1763538 RepID=A0A167DQ77_9BACL|nr:DUF4179 domain-containing protein [Paenibacillus crassostreae]AOZ91186.1 hypothetical protein LPB68_02480 [Paenibacillus crassostreae]OAB74655.1 hypothetical protein PNBC_11480 [Paenibacillus crassostreae]